MMTRKDYVKLAATMKVMLELKTISEHERGIVRTVAHELVNTLRADNARFDRDKFLTACGMD